MEKKSEPISAVVLVKWEICACSSYSWRNLCDFIPGKHNVVLLLPEGLCDTSRQATTAGGAAASPPRCLADTRCAATVLVSVPLREVRLVAAAAAAGGGPMPLQPLLIPLWRNSR